MPVDPSRELSRMADPMAELVSRQEISELVVKLARAMDRNDREGILACYHPGSIDHHGEFEGPVEQLVDFIDLLHRERVQTMYHLLGNHLFTVDGDHALGELYLIAVLRTRGEQPHDMVAGGRYLDRYERRAGRWRIAERQVVLDWQRFDPVPHLSGVVTVDVQERGSATPDDPSYRHFAGLTSIGQVVLR